VFPEPGVGGRGLRRGVEQVEALEERAGAPTALGAVEVVQVGDQAQVLLGL